MSSERAAMAPLDLDKYAEIAKVCKYLPENDLKVKAGSATLPSPFLRAVLSLPAAVCRSLGASFSLLKLTALASHLRLKRLQSNRVSCVVEYFQAP